MHAHGLLGMNQISIEIIFSNWHFEKLSYAFSADCFYHYAFYSLKFLFGLWTVPEIQVQGEGSKLKK